LIPVKLRLLDEAKTDLDAAANWYNERQDGLGDDFLAEATAAMRAIERDPFRFAKVERPRTKREIRRHSVKRFPYSIIYERVESEFIVLSIAHAKQRPSYWLRRKTD
jgi:plasmid stabilization system protein ParE